MFQPGMLLGDVESGESYCSEHAVYAKIVYTKKTIE